MTVQFVVALGHTIFCVLYIGFWLWLYQQWQLNWIDFMLFLALASFLDKLLFTNKQLKYKGYFCNAITITQGVFSVFWIRIAATILRFID